MMGAAHRAERTGTERPLETQAGERLAPTDDVSCFVVFAGGAMFGLPVDAVHAIFRLQSITPVPRGPAVVLGLVNLRGKIVTAISLARRLNLPDAGDDAPGVAPSAGAGPKPLGQSLGQSLGQPLARALGQPLDQTGDQTLDRKLGQKLGQAYGVAIESGGESYALVVDGVGDAMTCRAAERSPTPTHVCETRAHLTKSYYRIDQGILPVLDIDALFDLSPRRPRGEGRAAPETTHGAEL